MKKRTKSLLKNPLIILTMLMTILNLIGGNIPMSILFAVLFFGNVVVLKLDEIEEEKRQIRKLKEKEVKSNTLNKETKKEYTKKLSNSMEKVEEEIVEEVLFNILILESRYNITFEKEVNKIKGIINILLNKIIEETETTKSKNEIIDTLNNNIEEMFKIAKNNGYKIIKEEDAKQILNINNKKEYYYETSIKKQKNIYNW